MSLHAERRNDPRIDTARSVKVYDPRGRRYRPAQTHNVSASGALLEIHGLTSVPIGAQLDLAIDWSDARCVIAREGMVEATVVRSRPVEPGSQLIAVRFVGRQDFPRAA